MISEKKHINLHARGRRLHGSTRHFHIIGRIDQIFPLYIIRTDLAIELIPTGRCQYRPTARILIVFEQSAHTRCNLGRLVGHFRVCRWWQ